MRLLLLVCVTLFVSGCLGTPDGVEPVDDFELDRYLGTWFEIARLDHSFEEGLQRVTATYQLREDGGVRVINRGYAPEEDEWKETVGKAYFVEEETTGHLKVSFFGPFYSSYVVFELDKENYAYAFVTGNDRSYLWLLARTPQVPEELIDRFVQHASDLGYPTDELIYVEHP